MQFGILLFPGNCALVVVPASRRIFLCQPDKRIRFPGISERELLKTREGGADSLLRDPQAKKKSQRASQSPTTLAAQNGKSAVLLFIELGFFDR
jgi:hypothetical protein